MTHFNFVIHLRIAVKRCKNWIQQALVWVPISLFHIFLYFWARLPHRYISYKKIIINCSFHNKLGAIVNLETIDDTGTSSKSYFLNKFFLNCICKNGKMVLDLCKAEVDLFTNGVGVSVKVSLMCKLFPDEPIIWHSYFMTFLENLNNWNLNYVLTLTVITFSLLQVPFPRCPLVHMENLQKNVEVSYDMWRFMKLTW